MEAGFLTPLALLFVGLAVGVALDTLAAWLAVPEEGEDVPEDLTTSEAYPSAEAEQTMRKWRRLAIIGATGAAFAAAGARYHDPSHLALVTAYAAVLLLCAATDIMAYRVPNVVTYPAILIALGAGALMPDADLPRVLGGGALAGGILLAPALVTRGKGLGMGDIKLAAFVGLALGAAANALRPAPDGLRRGRGRGDSPPHRAPPSRRPYCLCPVHFNRSPGRDALAGRGLPFPHLLTAQMQRIGRCESGR